MPDPFLYAVELWSVRLLHERQQHFCPFCILGSQISPRPNTVCLPIPFFVLGIFAFLLGAVLAAEFAARLANWTLRLPALMLVVFAMLDRPAISGVCGSMEMDVSPLSVFQDFG